MNNNKIRLLLFGLVMLLAINACLFDVGRNDDGSLRLETNLTAEMLKTTLLAAANLPGDANVRVELYDGYVQVHSDRLEVQGITVKDVSFRMDMSANDGQLQVNLSDASVGGSQIEAERLSQYNDMIAKSLQTAAQQNDRATLENVSISPDGVLMVWRVDASINQ